MGKQKPKPKKPPPGKGPEGKKASTHVHNDDGRVTRHGDYIKTHCTCGAVVANDFAPE